MNGFSNWFSKRREDFTASKTYKELKIFLNDTWFLIKKNWRVVLPFLLVYSVFNIFVSMTVMDFIVKLSLMLSGLDYIGPDNMLQFFLAPGTIILFLAFVLLVCFLHIIEISGIMHVYSMSNVGKKPSLKGMISTGIMSGLRAFIPKNWSIVPFIIVLIPLTGFFTLSFSSFQAVIPGFVLEFIGANTLYSSLYIVAYILLLLVEITDIFALNFFILSDESFHMSCRKSHGLIKGRFKRTVLALIVTIIIFSLFTTVASSTVSSLLLQLINLFSTDISSTDAQRLSQWIITLNNFLGLILAPAVNIAALTALFFEYIEEGNMLASLSRHAFNDRVLRLRYIALHIVVLCAVIVFNAAFGSGFIPLRHNRADDTFEIVAHRGDATNAPENTYPAFELAVLENADWIELDVQQTKDGEIIVSHDDEISRVSGKHVYIHDLTFKEATSLDVGSYYSDEFSYVRFSTLDSVLKLCRDKVPVMVEIKYTGYGDHIEEKVLDIINSNGMHDQTLIISTHTPTLQRIKELDPTMITCYTMFVAYDNIGSIPYVDYYTVEESNISTALVNMVHENNGKVYAWTINDADSIQFLIDSGVDGILTDNPTMMKKIIPEAKYNQGLPRMIRLYLDELKSF